MQGRAAQDSTCTTKVPRKSRLVRFPILAWQSVSNRLPIWDCPFSESCSNHALFELRSAPILGALSETTNRIIRCNPLARFCYAPDSTGRLLDDSKSAFPSLPENSRKRVLMRTAVIMSVPIPGAVKSISGKWSDGVFAALVVGICGMRSLQMVQSSEYSLRLAVVLGTGLMVYAADMSWSLRRAFGSRPLRLESPYESGLHNGGSEFQQF
ncbi:membrane protein insertion efficiency factor YidD [bacterium]|nr:membrane protein insertion efficiency factor YidD [bacterium]